MCAAYEPPPRHPEEFFAPRAKNPKDLIQPPKVCARMRSQPRIIRLRCSTLAAWVRQVARCNNWSKCRRSKTRAVAPLRECLCNNWSKCRRSKTVIVSFALTCACNNWSKCRRSKTYNLLFRCRMRVITGQSVAAPKQRECLHCP